jgi:rod shape-determining protein MreD
MIGGLDINAFVGFILLIVSALLQTTVLNHLTVAGQRIDLVLLFVVSFAITRGAWAGLFWGAIGGLALDFMSALPFASHTVAMAIVAILVGLTLRRLSRNYSLLPLAAMPVVTALFYLLIGGVAWASGWPVDWQWLVGQSLLPAAVLNTIALPFIYAPVYTINKRVRVEINWQAGRS